MNLPEKTIDKALGPMELWTEAMNNHVAVAHPEGGIAQVIISYEFNQVLQQMFQMMPSKNNGVKKNEVIIGGVPCFIAPAHFKGIWIVTRLLQSF